MFQKPVVLVPEAQCRAALRRRPLLEDLEGRQMLSTLTVTVKNTNDSGTSSLRQAIDDVNAAGGGTIDFDIPSGLQKIELQSALPSITVPVYIDGLSQPESTANTPLIQIDGTDAGANATGLTLDSSASGSTVSGLLFTDFSDGGVLVYEATDVNLSDLVVGATEISGNIPVDAGNDIYGVYFLAGSNNTLSGSVVSANMGNGVQINAESGDVLTGDFIGTDVYGMRQVDAFGNPLGNSNDGVAIFGGSTYNSVTDSVIGNNVGAGVELNETGTDYNTIAGDLIGINANSTYALPNYNGVEIDEGASSNTIGALTSGTPSDVISGNNWDGVHIVDSLSGTGGNPTQYNVVEGDYIGVTANGTASMGNAQSGVAIYDGASGNTIGGTATICGESLAGAGNLISGNDQNGVYISDSTTTGNLVAGDYIGTSADGGAPVPNGTGVCIQNGAYQNIVGGTPSYYGQQLAGLGNVISGNDGDGVHIVNNASDNWVEGNYIGVTAYGNAALGNGYSGVAIFAGAGSNQIGLYAGTFGSGNVISGNGQNGVYISDSETSNNLVDGDTIGTDYTGSYPLPNGTGVLIQNSAERNTIGGTTPGTRDLISGNSGNGVQIQNGAFDNTVEGDYIGLGLAVIRGSTVDVGNDSSGVCINGGAYGNTIGGTASGTGNVISGNNQNGVYISDQGTNGNLIQGDYIGTNAAGLVAVPNGTGVFLNNNAAYNTIGAITSPGIPSNVISGNLQDGVHIINCANNNTVEGDYIGVNVDGTSALGNGYSGVAIFGGGCNNTIGGTASGSGNVISGNGQNGVYISDQGTIDNLVEGNDIGTDYTGSKPLPNSTGVLIQNGASGNTIGATTSPGTPSNVISGNLQDGVDIINCANDNTVDGDYIGVDVDGTSALGNGYSGVAIFGGGCNNTIGGTAYGSGNVISGNGQNGVYISDSGTTGNLVAGDLIGTDSTGSYSVPNSTGVLIQNGASCNTIGATTSNTVALPSNVISGNTGDGIDIAWGANQNVVQCDWIGLAGPIDVQLNGLRGVPNGGNGVAIYGGAYDNSITKTPGDDITNVIGFNRQNGVYIGGSGTTGNLVYFATIEYNGNNGVQVDTNATDNVIDTDFMWGNGASGVYIAPDSSGNTIEYCTLMYNTWGIFDTGSNDTDVGNDASDNTNTNYVY